jgi:hypothetical protein
MAFTDYPEFTVTVLPERKRRPRLVIGQKHTPKSVTKPHQHHVVTITKSTQLDTTERNHHDD